MSAGQGVEMPLLTLLILGTALQPMHLGENILCMIEEVVRKIKRLETLVEMRNL